MNSFFSYVRLFSSYCIVGALSVLAPPALAADSQFFEAREIAKRCKTADEPTTLISFKERDVLCLGGDIDSEMAQAVARHLRQAPRHLAVVVDSGGGSVASAINIADSLSAHGYDLIVAGKCSSSCANYLFVAASEKFLLQGARLGWHGSTAPRSFERYVDIFFPDEGAIGAGALQKLQKRYEASKHAQESFVRKYRVSEDIYFDHWRAYACALGAKSKSWRDYRGAIGQRASAVQWRPSLANLQARYGIEKVMAETPAEYATNTVSVTLDDGAGEAVTISDRCLFKQRP